MNINNEQWEINKKSLSSENGIVSSQNWIASSIGADVMNRGGNAIDAAVASAFALNVVEPWMCGLGGSGYMLIWLEKSKTIKALDFQGVLPEKIDLNDYEIDSNIPSSIMGFPGVKNKENILGYKSVTVPGAVSGLSTALENFGNLELDNILKKTIEIAEKGLPVDWYTTLQIAIESNELKNFESTANIFLPNGVPPKPEQFLKLEKLTKTLKKISENGHDEFYNGNLARDIVSDLSKGGSKITLEDLNSYKTVFIDPLKTNYKNKILYTAGKNSGGQRLNDTLNYIEKNLNEDTPFGKETYVTYAKALNNAFIKHKNKLKKNITHGCTSHLSTVDKDGNMVALTYTLLNRFGSKVVLPKTGILMNNSVSYFDPRPGYTTSIEGKKRINSSNMCPTICLNKDKGLFSIGASGANHIVPCTAIIAGFLLDFNFSLEKAFNLPRIDVNETNIITADPDLGEEIIDELKKYFKVEVAKNSVFPKLYSCPSGIYRNEEKINFGISDKSSPVAGAAIEKQIDIDKFYYFNDIQRA